MSLDLSNVSDADLKDAYRQSLAGLSDDDLKQAFAASSAAISPGDAGAKTVNKYKSPYSDDYLAGLDNDAKVNEYLDSIPAADKENARNDWARALVSNARKDGGALQRASDFVSRVSRNVMGPGSYLDEADAGLRSLFGQDYDNALAVARARDQAVDETPTSKLVSTPFGDVYTSGVEKGLGAIGGAIASPSARLVSGSGFIPGAINTGANAAAYSAADAFGQGEGSSDRIDKALSAGLEGAAIGAPVGAVASKFIGRGSPAAAAARQNSPAGEARQAAEDLRAQFGGPQSLPYVLEHADNGFLGSLAGGVRTFPGAAHVFHERAGQVLKDLGGNVNNVADLLANQGTGTVRGAVDATAAKEAAGNSAASAMQNYIQRTIPAENAADRAARDALLPADVLSGVTKAPMPNTMQAIQDAMDKAQERASPVGRQVFNIAAEGATRPEGMSLEGMSGYKSSLQAQSNNSMIPNYTELKDYMKPIGQASKEDVRQFINQQGGPAALAAHDLFMSNARQRILDRNALGKIVGVDPSTPNAGPKIIGGLLGMASESTRANEQGLMLAKKAMGPQAWADFGAAHARQLGEVASAGSPGQTAGWSADKFITAWGKNLSENSKSIIYGARGTPARDAMENIYTLSKKFQQLKPFQNTSGTAHSSAWFELGLFAHEIGLLEPISQVLGANAAAKFLTRQAGAQATSRWMQAIYNGVQSGKGQAAVRLTTQQLAKAISDQTGDDESATEAKLNRAMRR
jgi:hypothetical protein